MSKCIVRHSCAVWCFILFCGSTRVWSASRHSYRYLYDGQLFASSKYIPSRRLSNQESLLDSPSSGLSESASSHVRQRVLEPSQNLADNQLSGFGSWDGGGIDFNENEVQIIAQWHFYDPITVVDRNFYCKFPQKTCHNEFSGHSLLISNEFAGCREIIRNGELNFTVVIDPICSGTTSFPTCDKADRNETWQLFENCDDYYLVDSECRYDCYNASGEWQDDESLTSKLRCSFLYDKDNLWGFRDEHVGMCYIQDGECINDSLERHRVFCTGYKPDISLQSNGTTDVPYKTPKEDEKVLLCFGDGSAHGCNDRNCVTHLDFIRDKVSNGCPEGSYMWGHYGLACYANGYSDQPCFTYSTLNESIDVKLLHGFKSCAGDWTEWGDCKYSAFNGCRRSREFTARSNLTVECQWKHRTSYTKCQCQEPDMKFFDDPLGPVSLISLPCIGGFSEWGRCSDLCLRERKYQIIAPAFGGGEACSHISGDIEFDSCNEGLCSHPYHADPSHLQGTVITAVTPPMRGYAEKFQMMTNGLCVGSWGAWSECDELCRKYSSFSIANTSDVASCPEKHAHRAAVQCASEECSPQGVKTLINFQGLDFDTAQSNLEEFKRVLVLVIAKQTGCLEDQIQVTGIKKGSVIAEINILPPARRYDSSLKPVARQVHPGEAFDKLQLLTNQYEVRLGQFGASQVTSVKKVGVVPLSEPMMPMETNFRPTTVTLLFVGVVLGWLILMLAIVALICCCRRSKSCPPLSQTDAGSREEPLTILPETFGRGDPKHNGEFLDKTNSVKQTKGGNLDMEIEKMPTATDVELL